MKDKSINFAFPALTGSYPVGTKLYHWVDKSRKEVYYSKNEKTVRELMVRIWYPAQGEKKFACTPYDPLAVALWQKSLGSSITSFSDSSSVSHLKNLNNIRTHAQVFSNPVVNKKFPVVLFSHGFGAELSAYTCFCENLASHGYLVVGIDHTFVSGMTLFPDGRQKTCSVDLEQEMIEMCLSDINFVLNQLEQPLLLGAQLSGMCDLTKMGMFGHSLGGINTIYTCQRDARVKAGISLDGPLFGKNLHVPFQKPCMFFEAENFFEMTLEMATKIWPWLLEGMGMTEEEYKNFVKKFYYTLGPDVYRLVLKNSTHLTFSDLPVLNNFFTTLFEIDFELGAGSIDGFEAMGIINAYTVDFFDKYLKGHSSGLLDGESRSDLIKVERIVGHNAVA